jgi:tetratricopeptide (TPR) repeat protein/predicted Ser/Thr protein kinase
LGKEPQSTVARIYEKPPAGLTAPSFQGYEILEELGRGGMGVVYKARQIGLNRIVALKMILGGAYVGEAQRRRFQVEAEAVARLQHPNIVQIHQVGEQEGHPYFTLEYVDGRSLSERFRGPPLSSREAAHLISVLAKAIHCAHEQGIIHRDLKPGNVLLARDGTPKIVDFGLAKLLDDQDAHTRTGSVVGTPSYMAPEQALGQNRTIGPAADIYALGSILYEALTGRPPFRGETSMDLLIRLAKDDPDPPSRVRPGILPDLETICLRCLEKNPRNRYESAWALAEDLGRFLAHEPIRARQATTWERGVKWVKRRPTKAALLACVALVVLAFTIQATIQAVLSAHARQQRLDEARTEVHEVLMRAQEALKGQAWDAAEELLARAESKIESEPSLSSLPGEAGELIPTIRSRLTAHKTLQQFAQHRDAALFHATLATGEGASNELRAVRDQAREALALIKFSPFADETWSPHDSFSAQEKEELREKCYELLLVLAEAEGQYVAGQSATEQRQRAAKALRILDRAAALELRTTAYHLRRARFLELAGEPKAATEEAAKGQQNPHSSALDHYLLGDELYRQGKPKQALDEFERTLRLQPGHFWARYFLALCYIRLQQPALARDSLTTSLSQHPEIVWIRLMRGFAFGQLEDHAAAEADFADALQLLSTQPNDDARYVLYNNRAIMRVGQKNFDGAINDLREAIALRPRQYQAYASLAQVLHLQQRPKEAVHQLSEAIKAAEPLIRTQEVEAATVALLYRTRAHFQREVKDDSAALSDLDRALALAPEGSWILAQAQVERGQLLFLNGQLKESLSAYEAGLKARPEYALAHRGRGEVLFRLKRYSDAISAFIGYLKNGGTPTVGVYQALALAHIRVGDPKAALEDFTFALHLDPTNANLLTQRGQTFLACQSDQQRLALDDFDKAIASDPKNSAAYNGRARARLELGQVAEGVADADKALELGPRTATSVYSAVTLYACAAGKLDTSADRKSPATLVARKEYSDKALTLLAQSLELLPADRRAAFWRDTVQRDSRLVPIRRRIEFARLGRAYAIADASPSSD